MGKWSGTCKKNEGISKWWTLSFMLWKMRQDYLPKSAWGEESLVSHGKGGSLGETNEISGSTKDLTQNGNHRFMVVSPSMVRELPLATQRSRAETKKKKQKQLTHPASGVWFNENYPGRKPTLLLYKEEQSVPVLALSFLQGCWILSFLLTTTDHNIILVSLACGRTQIGQFSWMISAAPMYCSGHSPCCSPKPVFCHLL